MYKFVVVILQQTKIFGHCPKRKVIKMKKFASVLLAVLVAFSMFSFVVSAAAPKLTVSADKTEVKAGDVVTVTVKLAEKSGLGVLTFDVVYDATAFKAVDMKAGDLGPVVNANFADGKARATMATATTFENAGTVCTLKLEALNDKGGDISIAVVEACDGDFNNVTVDANKVTIKAAEVPPTTDEPTTDEPSTDEPSTDDDKRDHEWSTWAVTTKETCKKDGVAKRNCKICGEEETKAIPATGVCKYEWVETKKPTATEYGEKQLTCKMCGDVKETVKTQLKDNNDSLTNPSIPNTDAIA